MTETLENLIEVNGELLSLQKTLYLMHAEFRVHSVIIVRPKYIVRLVESAFIQEEQRFVTNTSVHTVLQRQEKSGTTFCKQLTSGP